MRRSCPGAGLVMSVGIALIALGCGQHRDPAPSALPTLPPPGTPVTFANLCAACHGVCGEGNLALRTPSIAGLPEWYVRQELEKFRSGQRGSDGCGDGCTRARRRAHAAHRNGGRLSTTVAVASSSTYRTGSPVLS